MLKLNENTATAAPIEDDQRWHLIERISATTPFVKSARLREFLKYVGILAISGRAQEINEQSIGVAVFARQPHYDCSADSIVRAHAVRLRLKLEEYFSEEGKHESLRIEIPKGGYVPVFLQALPDQLPPIAALAFTLPGDPSIVTAHGETDRGGISLTVWRFVSIYLAFTTAVLAIILYLKASVSTSRRAKSAGSVTLAGQFWTDLFSPSRTTIIVPGDNGLVLYENITGDKISLRTYLSDFRPKEPLVLFGRPESAIAANLSWRRITTEVDLEVTTALERLPSSAGTNLRVIYARDLRPNDLMNQDVILIGASEANPWVELYEPFMNFDLENDVQNHVFVVRNRKPKLSEADEYFSSSDDPDKKIYGVVAFLPNLNGAGNVLILEGTSQAGTEAAAQYVFDSPRLTAFLRNAAGNRRTVPYFEVLLESHKFADSASQSQIIAYRIH